MKRVVACLLCAALVLSLCTGCGVSSLDALAKKYEVADDGYQHDFAVGYEAFEPDTVILTVNGTDITWDEMFYWLRQNTISMEENMGEFAWDDMYNESLTYGDLLLMTSTNNVIYYKTIEQKADELHVTLRTSDQEAIDAAWDVFAADYDSDEAAKAALLAEYTPYDVYMEKLESDYLYNLCFASIYEMDGSGLTDEEFYEYLENNELSYMRAKHILLKTIDENGVRVEEAEQEAAKEQAEEVLAKLKAYTGDDLEGYFDELTIEYSQDAESSRDGFTFKASDMVEAFSNATEALEENTYSDLVQSAFGYHIILRLPLDPDDVPQAYTAYGYTLRYIVAALVFSSVVDGWIENADVDTKDAYKSISPADLLPLKD